MIRGEIAAREKIIAIEPFRDRDGIGRCRLVMQPKVIAVLPRPMRAFQGWRYFAQNDVPPDLGSPPAPASRRCPSRCAANCAISGCFSLGLPAAILCGLRFSDDTVTIRTCSIQSGNRFS